MKPTKISPSNCSGGHHFAKRVQRYNFFREFVLRTTKKMAENKNNMEFISSFDAFFVILQTIMEY